VKGELEKLTAARPPDDTELLAAIETLGALTSALEGEARGAEKRFSAEYQDLVARRSELIGAGSAADPKASEPRVIHGPVAANPPPVPPHVQSIHDGVRDRLEELETAEASDPSFVRLVEVRERSIPPAQRIGSSPA
jgi:hypothetical protein